MPDISKEGAHKYWQEYPDPSIYRAIVFLESVENWTRDNLPEFEESLKKLGEVLDNIGNIDLQQEDKFIELCSQLKASRALRLLQSMDTAHPGAASKLLMHAEATASANDDFSAIFLRRNIVFERLRIMGRIFSPERFALIMKAVEEPTHE